MSFASTIAPKTFTTADVIAAQALLISNLVRGQIDLQQSVGAYLFLDVARISTSAYTNPIDIVINRLAGTLTAGFTSDRHSPNNNLGFQSTLTASGTVTAQVNANTAVGDASFAIKTSNTGFTAYGSSCAFLGSTAPGSLTNTQAVSSFEVVNMSATSGSGPWTLTSRQKLGVVHAANDYITNVVDSFTRWLPGGFVYDVIFDANNIAAGAGAVVRAVAMTYPADAYTIP